MKTLGFLHEQEGFLVQLERIADAMNIEAHLIEKDYWLMHCLWGLKQQGWKFELKGGTSLALPRKANLCHIQKRHDLSSNVFKIHSF